MFALQMRYLHLFFSDFEILNEASVAVDGISEDIDISSLYYHDWVDSTCKVNATLLVEYCSL